MDATWPQRQHHYRYTVKAFDTATPANVSAHRVSDSHDNRTRQDTAAPPAAPTERSFRNQKATWQWTRHGQRRRQGLLPLPQRTPRKSHHRLRATPCAASSWGDGLLTPNTTYSYTVKVDTATPTMSVPPPQRQS